MTERPYSRLIGDLERDLAPLLAFVRESAYAERGAEPGASDLVFGNPNDPPVRGFVDALRRWAEPQTDQWFAYKWNEQPARETVAATLRARDGLAYESEDIHLTTGAFGALSVSLRTILEPGDEVVYVSPPWFFYAPMIRVAGGTPVRTHARPPSFDPDLGELAAAITHRTRAVILNSPNNPSGRIYSPALLDAVAALLREAAERNGRTVYLLSDESYSRILFDGRTFETPAKHYDATFVLYTYGKTLLAPGERVGWIALPPGVPERERLRSPIELSQMSGGWQFPNATLQYALPEFDPLSIDVAQLQRRRDRLAAELPRLGYEIVVPEATFYMLVRSPSPDDTGFTALLAEDDVFVLPGTVFELPGWIRLSVTANDEMVERALPVFEKALARARA